LFFSLTGKHPDCDYGCRKIIALPRLHKKTARRKPGGFE